MKNAKGNIMNKSQVRNWKSSRYVRKHISNVRARNCIIEYIIIYLNVCIDVANEPLPSRSNFSKHDISGTFDVKCAAIDASSGLRDTPTSAERNAEQSFAPSPHIKIVQFSFLKDSISSALCSGDILAKIIPFCNTSLNVL